MAYGSKLTCVKFAPTGFVGGGVGDGEEEAGEEDPEHATSASVQMASIASAQIVPQKPSNSIPMIKAYAVVAPVHDLILT